MVVGQHTQDRDISQKKLFSLFFEFYSHFIWIYLLEYYLLVIYGKVHPQNLRAKAEKTLAQSQERYTPLLRRQIANILLKYNINLLTHYTSDQIQNISHQNELTVCLNPSPLIFLSISTKKGL